MIIKNWKQMWKSYAVILPAIISAILLIVNEVVAQGLVPVEYIPVIMVVTGFIGRIVEQKNLGRE